MTAGLIIWDGVNYIDLDGTSRITRQAGATYTGTSDGSINVPMFATGQPFYAMVSTASLGQGVETPNISISGTNLVWTFPNRFPIRRNVLVIYGVSS